MSAPEPAIGLTDAGSSVKLVLNAKREVQIEAKIRVGDTDADVATAARIAQETFDRLLQKYVPGGAS